MSALRMSARLSLVLGFALLLVPFVSTPASAQTTFGVVGGASLTNLRFDLNGVTTITFDRRNGLFAGVAVTQPLPTTHLSLEVDALVQQAGARVHAQNVETSLTYLGLPVLVRYDLRLASRRWLHIVGGPSFNFKLSENLVAGFSESSELQAIEGRDIQLILG